MKALGRFFIQFYKKTDKRLVLLCLICSFVSAYMLFGICAGGFVRMRVFYTQLVATLLGIFAACVISLPDYRTLAKLWKIYLPVAYGLVLLTFFVGIQRYSYIDDRAWLEIPFIGITFQPSELLKLAFIYSFALHLERVKDTVNQPRTLAGLILHGAVPILLVAAQGDHGTAMVFAAVFVCMLFGAGLSFVYIGAVALAVAVASPIAWFFLLDDDKRGRFMAVFNPSLDPSGAGYQQTLGMTAIGSGQIWGKGVIGAEHQYVPEMHNDFIFAFIGESVGFVGCCGVILLLALVCLFLLLTARRAKDALGRNICIGVFGIIAFQSIWVIGMCLSLLPVAGLTLPLFSAGGTSASLTWAAIGMVLGVYRHSFSGLFDER